MRGFILSICMGLAVALEFNSPSAGMAVCLVTGLLYLILMAVSEGNA